MDYGGPDQNKKPEPKAHEPGTIQGPFRRLPKPTARVQRSLVKGPPRTKELPTPESQVSKVVGERQADRTSTRNVLASRDPNVSISRVERRSLSTQPTTLKAHSNGNIRKIKSTRVSQPSVAPRDAKLEPVSRASRKKTFQSSDLTTDEAPIFVRITEDQARELNGLPPRKKTFVDLDNSQKDLAVGDNPDNNGHIQITNSVADSISNEPQFHQLRQAIQNQPQMLEPALRQIETSNPNLARTIQDHPQEFQRLLYEGVEPAAARKLTRWFKRNWG